MGKFWDELKLGLRDQAVGAVKFGPSTSYGHNRDAMLAARAEREGRERQTARIGTAATDATLGHAYREAKAQRGRDVQFDSDGVKVLVKNGFSRRFNRYTTDIVLIDPGRAGEHLHIVLDEQGTEIHQEWTANH